MFVGLDSSFLMATSREEDSGDLTTWNLKSKQIFSLISFVQLSSVVSSEGALYVIVPYDYPAAAQHPLFEHTPVLNNNFEY